MKDSNFKLKETDGKEYIFDIIRRKYILLTSEEWVRQQILHYLVYDRKYPSSLISVEKQIMVGSRRRRYDIVVYKNDQPWLIVECKRETEQLNQHVLQQLLSYNSSLKVCFLVISNGKALHCFDIQHNSWSNQFPAYDEG